MANTDISLEPLINERYNLIPLEGYAISDRITGATSYFGFVRRDGAWYILKEVQAGAGEVNSTYAKGSSGYNWANRAAETYANFATTF